MKLLLDTHIALWATFNHPRLPGAARPLIEDESNNISVSVMSLWEIAIKHAKAKTGPEAMPVSAAQAKRHFDRAGFRVIAVDHRHALAVEALPSIHADPFDRMIVAQARSESMRLVTHDRSVAQYSEAIILV